MTLKQQHERVSYMSSTNDMITNPENYEVEKMIKDTRDHDLSVDQFATISGIQGMQFEKEIFVSVLKFKDLIDFLSVFPSVQRRIIKSKVMKIKRYVLSGIEDPSTMRFFPSLTVTARGHIYHDKQNSKIAIDARNSKLSINDGQHRFMGIGEAILQLRGELNKSKDSTEQEKIKEKLNRLNEMSLPITIVNNLTEEEEKQLFHDSNFLPQRPSRSATIRLAQTDLYSKMSRELAEENKYLTHYGVEFDKMSIKEGNENTVLLTTIYAFVKLLFKANKQRKDLLTKETYESFKQTASQTLDMLFYVLPHDIDTKGKYLLEKNYTLKGIARFIHHARNELKIEEDVIFATIQKVDWRINLEYWRRYDAVKTKGGHLQFGGSGETGARSIFDCLVDVLNDNK